MSLTTTNAEDEDDEPQPPQPPHPLARFGLRCSHHWLARLQDAADFARVDMATYVEQAIYRNAERLGDLTPWPTRIGQPRPGSIQRPLEIKPAWNTTPEADVSTPLNGSFLARNQEHIERWR